MVYYPIQTLVQAGISEVMIVVGGPHAGDFMGVLRNGKEFGIKHLEYAYQENEGGIAQALALCEDFADGGEIAVILGDNTTDADIRPAVQGFAGGACSFSSRWPTRTASACRSSTPRTRARIVHIDEKPKDPKSNYAVTGLYLYDGKVFEYIRRTKPSGRGELEISDVNNFYIEDGRLTWAELQGFWSDAGTFESLYRTGKFWAEKALGLARIGRPIRNAADAQIGAESTRTELGRRRTGEVCPMTHGQSAPSASEVPSAPLLYQGTNENNPSLSRHCRIWLPLPGPGHGGGLGEPRPGPPLRRRQGPGL